ncbi:hypothetical protein, partial [Treponema sp.]|uniref:hypothetical protein n=1 Tax=Treponema sp. TaxID=166 RepID=UPI00298E1BFE
SRSPRLFFASQKSIETRGSNCFFYVRRPWRCNEVFVNEHQFSRSPRLFFASQKSIETRGIL